jgi:radical SAM superfamily enzyme YgiQ (UPF0313 family)
VDKRTSSSAMKSIPMVKKQQKTASQKKTINSVAESGAIKKNWHGRKSVALIYPNIYHVGMSNLGFQTVYSQLNGFDGIVCERVFLPATESRNHIQLRSVESNRVLSDFNLIAFSISFENDYLNVLTLLEKAGFPLLSVHRNNELPLIIAGGVTCFLNPEPIAPFIDAFLIGEAEEIIPSLAEGITEFSNPNILRENRLLELAHKIPGAYVPAFYKPHYHDDGTLASFFATKAVPSKIRPLHTLNLSSHNCHSTILTADTTFNNTFLIEVSRGCAHGCRFCSAGYIYRPPRFRTLKHIENNLLAGKAHTNRIGLVGAAVSDLPDIEKLCTGKNALEFQIGFSSLRADALSDKLITALRNSGTKTVAIAPDAGSQRLRSVINKGLNEEKILTAITALVQNNIPNIKLYFMIGLPTETNEDINAISALCKKIKHNFLSSSKTKGKIGEITVSLNSFVPKPFTPFQWVAMDDVKSLKYKIKQIKKVLGKVANIKIHADIPRWAFIQAILSRGDRRVAQLLLAVHKNGGNWTQALKSAPINPLFYVQRERFKNELLPWDFIDHGIDKSFLWDEFKRALSEISSPPCPMDPQKCRLCGVCG